MRLGRMRCLLEAISDSFVDHLPAMVYLALQGQYAGQRKRL